MISLVGARFSGCHSGKLEACSTSSFECEQSFFLLESGLTGEWGMWWDELMRWLCYVMFWWVVDALVARAEEGEWSVRGYACPGDVLLGGFEVEGRGKLELPSLNADTANPEVLQNFIMRSSAVFREYLPELPKGSLVILDRELQTLAARTTRRGHEAIEAMVEDWASELQRMIVIEVKVLNIPARDFEDLLEESELAANHAQIMARLEQAGTMRACLKVETKSKQPASIEANGLHLQVEPVMSLNGKMIDANLLIQNTRPSGVRQDLPLKSPENKPIDETIVEFEQGSWSSSTTVTSGQPRFLGGLQNRDGLTSTVSFLTATTSIVRRKPDRRAEGWLVAQGDAVEPIPMGVEKVDAPPNMIRKRFEVPPDFLKILNRFNTNSSQPENVDRGKNSESNAPIRRNVEPFLTAQGIDFPAGSSAIHNRQSSTLTVYNEPKNIDLVETFVDAGCLAPPKMIRFCVQVIEAEAEILQELSRDNSGLTDHKDAWDTIQKAIDGGRGRAVDVVAIETRSGQRCSVVRAEVTRESKPKELRVELKPSLGPDGISMDVDLSMKRVGQETARRFIASNAQEERADDSLTNDFHPLGLTTSFGTVDGMWRMIGTWHSSGADGKVMQALFVRAGVMWIIE